MQNQLFAWIGSWLLGIAGVSIAFTKYYKQVKRALRIAQDSLALVNNLLDACQDNSITPDEIQKLKDDLAKIQSDAVLRVGRYA